ncbi:uncharacterized protein LOC134268282 [Saccostrea cucullata]|uniref:uncharacterized protein LOC134268282 n=1 Tax=Saccostrea cuccullata TaxID=36930 RepID=UPI002ED2B0B8
MSLLESENKILKERVDKLNSTSTFLLQENIILKDQIKILNSTSMLIQRNMTTAEDLRKMESILTFKIEQTARVREQEMMKNISATVKDLELRDRYLSLSFLDVHSNMTILDHALSNLMQQQKKNEEQQKMTIQNLSLSLLDVHNNTERLSSSLSSLDAQQKRMKSEIQTLLTNLQQTDITKLNDTIIHYKNSVQFNVAFTAGILREYGRHTYTIGATVKFPTVIYQVGGGYNPTTGVFTAPKAGLYIIFCTNMAAENESSRTKMMINGSVKARFMAWLGTSIINIYQSASNLVVHQLLVGDRVWIQVYDRSHLYSDFSETTFSVIMINGSD